MKWWELGAMCLGVSWSDRVVWTFCWGTELKGASPEILQRLIPEHARKQNPMLAL